MNQNGYIRKQSKICYEEKSRASKIWQKNYSWNKENVLIRTNSTLYFKKNVSYVYYWTSKKFFSGFLNEKVYYFPGEERNLSSTVTRNVPT